MKTFKDLVLLTWERMDDWDVEFTCSVLANSSFYGGNEVEESRLADLVGRYGEDVVFNQQDLGTLYQPVDGFEGPWRVLPAIVVYQVRGDETIKVKRVIPLDKPEIQRMIDFHLEEK